MKWIVGIFCYFVGIFLTYKQSTFLSFIIPALIFGSCFFGIYLLGIHIRKVKEYKKILPTLGIIFLTLTIIFLLWSLFFARCVLLADEPHFRTNTLTGECDFEKSKTCSRFDPWFYEYGCDVSLEEKKEIIMNSDYIDYVKKKCENVDEGIMFPYEIPCGKYLD